MVLLLVRRGEEVVNLWDLRGTKGHVDEINKEEVEKETKEEVEEETLLPYQGVKCNILYILYR